MKIMWKSQIILFLCILYIKSSLAKPFRSENIDYDYQVESRRHSSSHRLRKVATTSRPLLQHYWHSFVRKLPTLPPLSWNITNPIGTIFNADTQQIVETPVAAMHYVTEKPNKKTTKTNKRKHFKKNENGKGSHSREHFNRYNNGYQQTYMQLEPLGLDQNRVMHFYEPSSGQYYSLQIEPQPLYHNNQYAHQYNQQNEYENSDDDNHDGDDSSEDESYYAADDANFEDNRYNAEDNYNNFETENQSSHNDYDTEYAVDNIEDDDAVELMADDDEDIFADRKIKGSDNSDTVDQRKGKIQKHLLRPETEDDVKVLLNRGQKVNDKTEKISMKKDKSALSTFNRKQSTTNTKKNIRATEKSRKMPDYYLFPVKFW